MQYYDLVNESLFLTSFSQVTPVTKLPNYYTGSLTDNNDDRVSSAAAATLMNTRLDNYHKTFNDSMHRYISSFLIGMSDVEEQHDHHQRQLTTSTTRTAASPGFYLSPNSTSSILSSTMRDELLLLNSSTESSSSSSTVSRSMIPSTVNEPGGGGVLLEFPGKNIIIPLYTLIFFLSIIGNILVILTLARNRRMRTVTNVFLLNLAVSDLLLGVFCMPFTLIGQILRNFIFGNVMCKIIPYLQAISVSVGVWTLVAISLERYFAICRPLQSRKWQTTSHAYKMIAGVWIATLLWNIPISFVSQLQPMGTSGRFRCRENWPNTESEKVFNLTLDFLLLLIPLCIMGLAYSLIASKLWKGLKSEIRHTKAYHRHGSPGMLPSENSMELSSHSHYSTCRLPNNSTPGHSTVEQTGMRKSNSRDFVPNEIVTLKGGKGVVVRWKRKDAVEVADAPDTLKKDQLTKPSSHHLQVNNHHHKKGAEKREMLKASRGLNFSRTIRSTYTGKSIESKKKVIRMLFVLVLEFFVCWAPLYVMNTWWLFHPKAVYDLLSPLGVSLIQLLAYASSCCNPVTYCFMNRKFRQAFLKLFQCMVPFGRKPGPPTIGRGSDLSANDSLVFGVHGTTMNKSEVVVLECEERV